jgi:hypothetical protein
MSVKNILSEQFKDIITEETLNSIEEAFQQAVTESVNQKIGLETENVKNKLDEEYTAKLQTLVEKIDDDHTAKLKKLVEAIDTDHAVKLQKLVKDIDKKHTKMLETVIEKYEGQMKQEAQGLQESLVEQISNYLDLYLDKAVPTKQISEAVENIKAVQQLKQIRQIVGINEEFIDQEVKEALIDGKNTIDSLKAELNSVLKENVDLAAKANKAEAHILLEKKTVDMPAAKKAFVNKLLKNKNPEYIEENFSYVVEMFEKETLQEVEEAKEQLTSKVASKVDRPQLVEEKLNFENNEIEATASSGAVNQYLNEMVKISKNKYTR